MKGIFVVIIDEMYLFEVYFCVGIIVYERNMKYVCVIEFDYMNFLVLLYIFFLCYGLLMVIFFMFLNLDKFFFMVKGREFIIEFF